jgi:hypothetical protein
MDQELRAMLEEIRELLAQILTALQQPPPRPSKSRRPGGSL